MQNAQTLKVALGHHQAGRLSKAENMYRSMLRKNGADHQLLHLMAIVADQQGRLDEALQILQRATGPGCPIDNLRTYAEFLTKAKRYEDAEVIFKRALTIAPKDAVLYANLGENYRHMGKLDDQVAAYRMAVALNPDYSEAHNNLAIGLHDQGDHEAAIASFYEAAKIKQSATSWNNLGLMVFKRDDYKTAQDYFQKALDLDPGHASALNNMAVTLFKMGFNDEAFEHCKLAIEADPDNEEAHKNFVNSAIVVQRPFEGLKSCLKLIERDPESSDGYAKLAHALIEQGRYPEGIIASYKALQLKPDDQEAYHALLPALCKANRIDEALSACARLLQIDPNKASNYCVIGLTLSDIGRSDDALTMCGKALELDPTNPMFYHALASISHTARRYQAAIELCGKVLEMKPNYNLPRWDRSLIYLLTGDFKNGWQEFESRWDTNQLRNDQRNFEGPVWKGEDLQGKTLLLTGEQGMGDVIQFARYVPHLVARGAKVDLYAQDAIAKLLEGVDGIGHVYSYGTMPGAFDYQCPIMSMPLRCDTDIDTIPFKDGYLHADPAARERWRQRVARPSGLKIGLVWAGNSKHRNNRNRSMKLELFRPLLDIPGINWFSLQVGDGEDELEHMPHGVIDNLRPGLTDFTETAAAISELDLVISVDTSTIHLAGALGKPGWVLLPYVPDWRWMEDRRDSPWYSSLLLFRQSTFNDWPGVIEDVGNTLRAVLEADGINAPGLD